MRLSVVIPALDERERIAAAVQRALREGAAEVVVADGGSADGTAMAAGAAGARVVAAPRGRGPQQNAGARAATGDTLLFLHADTTLPAGFPAEVDRTLARRGVVAGAFGFRLDDDGFGARLVERMVALRCRWFDLPYGDQALFLRRDTFERVGGFPEIPLLEDYEIVRRLRRVGKVALARGEAVTSARRWRRLGLVRATVSNNLCLAAYRLGVPPERIAAWRR